MIDYSTLDKSRAYVAASEGFAWYSKVIKFFTRSHYSHAFILFWDENWGQWMALGDNDNGWTVTPANTENTLAVVHFKTINLWDGLRTNADLLGSFYDYPALIGMAWVMLGKWVFKSTKQWKNPFNMPGWYICSEICAKIIQDSGFMLDLIQSSTDPRTLIDTLAKSDLVEVVISS